MIWHKFPALRLLLGVIAGIWIHHQYPGQFRLSLVLLLVLFLVNWALLKWKFRFARTDLLRGFLLNFLFLLGAYVLSSIHSQKIYPDHFLNHDFTQNSIYRLELKDQPLDRKGWWRCTGSLRSQTEVNSQRRRLGKVILYLEVDSNRTSPHFGDQLLIQAQLQPIQGPKNPYEFDYQKFLENNAIYAQAFVSANNWKLLSKAQTWHPQRISSRIQNYFLKMIDQWPVNKEVRDLSKALLLGYRSDIDPELLKTYGHAGATHILAVSGLHVGVIYIITSYLLSFLKRIKRGEIIRSIILLLFLWSYAMVTGLSPSVLRAVSMFSFMAFAALFQRDASIYNTLIASALVLLIADPSYLFNVGFQLSYVAVFFIVWIQGRIEALWSPRLWILKKAWAISSVSIAAQLGTLPISLYYFHQFPLYFLLTNLMVIPMVSILMYLGLATLVLGVFSHQQILIEIYAWLVEFMNCGVRVVNRIPGGIIEQIHLHSLEVFLLYGLIITSFSWLYSGHLWKLRFLSLLMLLFSSFRIVGKYHQSRINEYWIYSLKGGFALSHINGFDFKLIAEESILKDSKLIHYHIQPHISANRPKEVLRLDCEQDSTIAGLKLESGLLQIQNSIFWIFDSKRLVPNADYWIIKSRQFPPKKTLDSLPKKIISVGELNPNALKQWKQWCQENELEFINVLVSGAYQIANF